MWEKIGKIIIQSFLLPLVQDFFSWVKRKIENRKQKKEVWSKYKDYNESNNADDFNNTFDDLP